MAQLSFLDPPELPREAYQYGIRASGDTHGVVLTKPHVVALILDLARYTADRDLHAISLLEPACGEGAFLVQAVDRLMRSANRLKVPLRGLQDAITAFDIDDEHIRRSRAAVGAVLRDHGVSREQSGSLASRWINQGDFLLAAQSRQFGVVVGNPPYIRIEKLDPQLQVEYRRRFKSLYDRADLYVGFIEHGLNLLAQDGLLSFICADRWTSNRYGSRLRQHIADGYGVECYIDLHNASPFESEVSAYPSIFCFRRGKARRVNFVRLATASPEECREVLPAIEKGESPAPGVTVSSYESWFQGDEPWVISSPSQLAVLRELESRCQPLEASGQTKVGIGVATGNDKVYIVGEDADIEPDRLVPLVMRADIERGRVCDSRRFVINTFRDDGRVVDLSEFPRLSRYLDQRIDEVKRRHVAQKNPKSWFRTIDRVYPALVRLPKLLIPDIAGSNEVVFEEGRFHPHHNLYFVTSEVWDLEVLGGLLSSRVALFFVWSYAVKMRGGYLRFQAQFLRRIRVPSPSALGESLSTEIRTAFRARDFPRLDQLAIRAYGLQELPEFSFVETRE